MQEKIPGSSVRLDSTKPEVVIATPAPALRPEDVFTDPETQTVILPEAPPVNDGGIAEVQEVLNELVEDAPEIESVQVWHEGDVVPPAVEVYGWPVIGELERTHDLLHLSYDPTMHDWRTHDGIDILCELGAVVKAAHAGTVESITNDAMLGTVVVVDHGDGVKSIYANLADVPAVSVGDRVECGSVIGSVSDTALCESGQGIHLHFAMKADGISVDPMNYLPA